MPDREHVAWGVHAPVMHRAALALPLPYSKTFLALRASALITDAARPQSAGSMKYYWVVASLEPGDDELAHLIRGTAARFDRSRAPRNLRFFFEDIDQCCRINSDLSMTSAGHHTAGLLYALLASQQGNHTTARSFAYVDRAIAYMQESIRQEISLADICAELHITEAYFIRIFKSHMGVAPMKYLMRLKIDAAAGLLLETNLPVHEIGETLNFNSDAHFSRTFKQHMDINPLSYRNRHVRQLRSEKEKSEKELANAYRFLETLIDASPDLIFFKSTDSIIMGCNESFCRMVGLAKDQIVGRSDFEIFPREIAEFFLAKDKIIYQQNKPFKNEEWLDFPSGERKKYEVYKAPFRDAQGKVLGLFGGIVNPMPPDVWSGGEAVLPCSHRREAGVNRREVGVNRSRRGARAAAGAGVARASASARRAPAAVGMRLPGVARGRRATGGVTKRRVDRTRTPAPAERRERHRPLRRRADPIAAGRGPARRAAARWVRRGGRGCRGSRTHR